MRVRNLFMRDIATGAEFELGEIKEIEIVPADPDERCVSTTLPSLTGTFEVSLDVFLQPNGHPSVQLLVLHLGGHDGTLARYPLCAAIILLRSASGLPHTLGAAALHAHLLLCAEELAELHQAQPVGYLRD